MTHLLFLISALILVYFFLLMIASTLLLVFAFPKTLSKFKEDKYGNIASLISHKEFLPMTVIIPVYNSGKMVLDTVYSVLNNDYRNVEIILVNDGSTDDTLPLLVKEFYLYEAMIPFKETLKTAKIKRCFKSYRYLNIMLIDKVHSRDNNGADAINTGINACRTPLYLTVDADTILDSRALSNLLFTFLSRSHAVVVGGAVYVLNGNVVQQGKVLTTNIPKQLVPGMQSIEYLRSFLYSRAGWDQLGGALCYAGAFTLFETQAVREIGGYDTPNPSYDMEIIIKMHYKMRTRRNPHVLTYTSSAMAWTQVPATWKAYWRQRNFWQRGMLRSCFHYTSALFNARYGIFGLFSLPFYLFFETLCPVVEFISYLLFLLGLAWGLFDAQAAVWFLALAWGYIVFISLASLFLNAITFNQYSRVLDIFRTIGLVSLEMLGFRQYRALCCSIATVQYVINRLKGRPQ